MVISDILSDLCYMLGVLVFVLCAIFIPKILKEEGIISRNVARKLIHSLAGLAVFIVPYLNYPIIAGIFALILTIVVRFSKSKSEVKPLRELFHAISEAEELEVGYLQGPFAYCLAITILMFVFLAFPYKYYFPIAAILVMMFADSVAAIIGRKYGKHHINVPWVGNKRTIEGSLAFFLSALILTLMAFFFFGYFVYGHLDRLTIPEVLLFSGAMSAIAMGLELISPSKFDDLIIPLGSTLLISLLAFILGIW